MLDISQLFDQQFYLNQNPDVANALAAGSFDTAFDHFIKHGQFEGRNPSAFFDTSFYLQQNPDVAAAVATGNVSAIEHFVLNGQFEGRNPNPLFNPTWYIRKNPDLAAAFKDEITGLYEHYVVFGSREGRDPSALFDNQYYLQQNPDVANALAAGVFKDALTHFVTFGEEERRNPSAVFDNQYYLANNPDVDAALQATAFDGNATDDSNAIEHFVAFGSKEDRLSIYNWQTPETSGPFEVGYSTYELTDPTRDETFTVDPTDKRRLKLDVYYPTFSQALPKLFYYKPPEGNVLIESSGLPAVFQSVLQTNASYITLTRGVLTEVPVGGNEAFPVLLFAHGLGGNAYNYTAQLEELASIGYIVVAINYPGIAGLTAFSDGKFVPFSLNFGSGSVEDLTNAILPTVGVAVADTSFVLTQLGNLNATDPLLKGRMDLTKVGMFGQSFGGVTTTALMQIDPRVQAGISLDGPVLSPTLAQVSISKPFMQLNAENTYLPTDFGRTVSQFDQRQQVFNKLSGPGYSLTVAGTEHSDFSDRPLLLPLISLYSPDNLGVRPGSNLGFLTDTGYIQGDRSLEITRNYTGAFFDRYLKNIPSTLLAATNSAYPEVAGATRNI